MQQVKDPALSLITAVAWECRKKKKKRLAKLLVPLPTQICSEDGGTFASCFAADKAHLHTSSAVILSPAEPKGPDALAPFCR